MKTLVWPDVHNRTGLLKRFLKEHGDKFDKRIFLGDFFDQFEDTPADALRTAEYVLELLSDPRNILLEGNHDSAYRYNNPASMCSGWEPEKALAVKKVLHGNHWDKFKLCYFEQGFLCSHAGVHERVFGHPVHGISVPQIEADCEKAVDAMRCNIMTPPYWDGQSVGGRYPVGGITWLRWWEFHPIPGLNQIVGHTIRSTAEVSYARKKISKHHYEEIERIENVKVTLDQYINMPPKKDKLCSINFNIDTNNAHFIILENGEATIQLTLDYL